MTVKIMALSPRPPYGDAADIATDNRVSDAAAK